MTPCFFGGWDCGFNPVTGLIDDTGDNCALVNNPAQVDTDGKVAQQHRPDLRWVRQLPAHPNPDQADGDLDGWRCLRLG